MIIRSEPKCPFYMRSSKMTSNEYEQLMSFTKDHTCNRRVKNRQFKIRWFVKNVVFILRHTLKKVKY